MRRGLRSPSLRRLRAVREPGADRQPEEEPAIVVSDDAASLHPDDVLAAEHAAQHKITRLDHSPRSRCTVAHARRRPRNQPVAPELPKRRTQSTWRSSACYPKTRKRRHFRPFFPQCCSHPVDETSPTSPHRGNGQATPKSGRHDSNPAIATPRTATGGDPVARSRRRCTMRSARSPRASRDSPFGW